MTLQCVTLKEAVEQMTPRSVEQWLEGRLETKTRFIRNCCYFCLFAVYLGYITQGGVGTVEVSIGYAVPYLFVKNEGVALPEWSIEVIKRFDTGSKGSSLGVKSSLRILREVCPELKKSASQSWVGPQS